MREVPDWLEDTVDEDPYELGINRPDFIFERLSTLQWIEQIREPETGLLDMAATAQRANIPLDYEYAFDHGDAQINGLGIEEGVYPLGIHLNPERSADGHRVSFGHELGHYFIEKVARYHFHDRSAHNYHAIERLVEFIGREIALPSKELKEIPTVDAGSILQLSETYQVPLKVVFLQLMVADKLPPKIAIDTKVPDKPDLRSANEVSRTHICLSCEYTGGEICLPTEGVPVLDYAERSDLWEVLPVHREENLSEISFGWLDKVIDEEDV